MKLERKNAFPVVDLLPGPRIFRRKTVFSKKKTPCSHTRSAVSGKEHNEYGLELPTYVTSFRENIFSISLFRLVSF